MINIFIANLDWSITSEDLKTTFSSFGEVHYAHVVFEKETKRSQGFGYIEMEDAESAIRAIQALNGVEINGRPIDVKIASPKTNRPPRKEKVAKKYVKKPKFNKPREGGYKTPYQKTEVSEVERKQYVPKWQNSEESKPKESDSLDAVKPTEPNRILRPRKPKTEE
jgi:RNA recognition motif-containing protein